MKNKLIIGLLVISVFLIAGCNVDTGEVVKEIRSQITEDDIDKAIKCETPYIRHEVGCCLDQNDNKICDKDESLIIEEEIKSNCGYPYISTEYNQECCLDKNSNNVCDIKENVTEESNKASCDDVGLHIYKTELNGFTILVTLKNTGNIDIEKITYTFDRCDQFGTIGESLGLKKYEIKTFEIARGRGPNEKVTAYPWININGEIIECENRKAEYYGQECQENECIDTDGGSVYVKGSVSGTTSEGNEFGPMYDYCSTQDSSYLKEYRCDENTEASWKSEMVLCDNGCNDGACK